MQFSEWVRQEGDKVIITDNIKNVNAMIRNLNRKTGVDVWRLQCKKIQEIVLELLTAYKAKEGILKPLHLLQPQAGVYLLNALLLKEQYTFLPKECYCMKTTRVIYQSMQQLRMNHTTNAYEAERESKVADLKAMICAYEERLHKEGYYDTVTLLKEGIRLLKKLQNKEELLLLLPWCRLVSFGTFSDMEYTGLESDFLQMLLKLLNQEMTILTYYIEGKTSSLVQYRFFKAYGIVNEVQYVVNQILEQRLPFGEVNVFYTGSEYESFIKGLFGKHNIDCRFLTGESLQENKLMNFIQGVLRFAEEDFLYERLAEVVENPWMDLNKEKGEQTPSAVSSYNHFLKKGIGWGKERYAECILRVQEDIENSEKYSRFLVFMEDLLAVFDEEKNCGALYGKLLEFAGEYTREGKERNLTLAILKEQKSILAQIEPQENQAQTIALLREYLQEIESGQEVAADAVNVIQIGNRMVLERRHNFFIGLSAKQFMADMNESPVLSDEQLQLYVAGKIELAKEKGSKLRENVLKTLATLEEGVVYMGYSTYDTLQLKEGAPSVFYQDCLESWGTEEAVEQQRFDVLKGPLHMCRFVPEVDEEKETQSKKEHEKISPDKETLFCKMSPSGLQALMECPLKYYYHYQKGIGEREFLQKSASEWLNPAKKGNLFHYILEDYCKEVLMHSDVISGSLDEVVLKQIFEQKIQFMLKEQPYVSQTVFEQERKEAWECCLKYLKTLHHAMNSAAGKSVNWRVLGCELKFEALAYPVETVVLEKKQEVTICFNGSIDRLDGYVDGNGTLHLQIVDYKTGKLKRFEEELGKDKKLQHYIYAGAAKMLAEQEKAAFETLLQAKYQQVEIDGIHYVFPYEGAEISCTKAEEKLFVLPDSVKERLKLCMGYWLCDMDEHAYEAMKAGSMFLEEKEQCKYCTYGRVCRRRLDK